MDLSRREILSFFLASIYIMILSLAPLVSDLFVESEWIGYGNGAYYYKTERLEVRISGVGEGSGKPKIYLFAQNMSYRPVLLIEIDDRESAVDGQSLYYDLQNLTIRVQDHQLTYIYELEGLAVKKIIAPGEDHVNITILAEEPAHMRIVMRGRNYTAANNIYLSREHEVLELGLVDKVELSFIARGIGHGVGRIALSSPASVTIVKDGRASKILVDLYGKELIMTVSGEMESQHVSQIAAASYEIISHKTIKYLLPLAALIAIVGGWFLWRRE